MNGGGPGSGIWKSTDGGDTWTRLKGGGWPEGPLGPHRRRRLSQAARTSSTRSIEGPAPATAAADAARRPGELTEAPRAAAADAAAEHDHGADADTRDRALSIGRRRRDVAEGERRKPAADVFQPGAHRSERSRRRRLRRRRSAFLAATRARPCTWTSPSRSTTTCTRSGSIRRTRTTCIIGNDGGLAASWDQAKTWNFYPEHSGRPLLSRERRQRDAVQHLRRHAGQLQLVRAERGARQRPASPASTGRRCRAATGSSRCRIRSDYRIAYSESQDGNMVRIDRVTGETDVDAADCRTRASRRSAMELGHAARHVAAQPEHHLRGRQQGVPLVEPRSDLGDDRRRSHRATPTATTSSRWA